MAKAVKREFVVIGLGLFGTSLTRKLYEDGASVLVIDKDPDKINEIDAYCTQAICADATDERILEKLGIKNMDVGIVCIASEIEASIFITLTLKQMGLPLVIAKAQNERHKDILKKIGADLVLVPEEEMGMKIGGQLTKPNMIEILSLNEKFRIIEIKTPVKWQNKTLMQLKLTVTEKVTILLIKRGDEVIVTPDGSCTLLPDDIIVLSGSVADTKRVAGKATETILDEFDAE
ncbi:MAG: TrkA family potassium uptake protein [Clostridia bacterium]|nr:TrkA family potassium uptake protein [Clostridia bacterium]